MLESEQNAFYGSDHLINCRSKTVGYENLNINFYKKGSTSQIQNSISLILF